MLEEARIDYDMARIELGSAKHSAIFRGKVGMLPETMNLGDYGARCTARPAYQRSLAKGAA